MDRQRPPETSDSNLIFKSGREENFGCHFISLPISGIATRKSEPRRCREENETARSKLHCDVREGAKRETKRVEILWFGHVLRPTRQLWRTKDDDRVYRDEGAIEAAKIVPGKVAEEGRAKDGNCCDEHRLFS